MTWYIVDVNSLQPHIGGLGHMFYLHLTPHIIGMIFNIETLYTPFVTASDEKHMAPKSQYKRSVIWDKVLQFERDQKRYEDLEKEKNYKKVQLPHKKPFTSYTYEELENFFATLNRKEKIIFTVGNSNRILPGELQKWCVTGKIQPNIYKDIITSLRHKCIYKSNIVSGLIVVHIRRGDVVRLPLEYYKHQLDLVLGNCENHVNCEIIILSLGTVKQMTEIREYFQKHFSKFVGQMKFQLNTDAIESFQMMMNADVLIGGYSSFPKVAGLYSDGKKYFLPFEETKGAELPLYDPCWINAC